MTRNSLRVQTAVALWTVYLVWGSTYLAIRYAVRTIPPMIASSTRYLAAAAVLALVLRIAKGSAAMRVSRPELLSCAMVGILLCMGGNGLVMVAEQTVPSGLAALLIACVPLFVVILRRLGGEIPARATVVGVLIGLIGVAVLLLPGTSPHGVKSLHLALNILAPALWSVGSYISTRRPMPANPFVATTYEMAFGGLAMLLTATVRGDLGRFSLSHVTASSGWAWLYLVGPGSLVAMSAYVWLLANAPLSTVATYSFVNPVVAVALGALISDERITLGTLVGGAVIVVAVAVVVRSQGREAARAAPRDERLDEELVVPPPG